MLNNSWFIIENGDLLNKNSSDDPLNFNDNLDEESDIHIKQTDKEDEKDKVDNIAIAETDDNIAETAENIAETDDNIAETEENSQTSINGFTEKNGEVDDSDDNGQETHQNSIDAGKHKNRPKYMKYTGFHPITKVKPRLAW